MDFVWTVSWCSSCPIEGILTYEIGKTNLSWLASAFYDIDAPSFEVKKSKSKHLDNAGLDKCSPQAQPQIDLHVLEENDGVWNWLSRSGYNLFEESCMMKVSMSDGQNGMQRKACVAKRVDGLHGL